MSVEPPEDLARALRSRAVIHGLVCAALALAFFSTRTPGALPLLRLRQTRLDLLLHLTCNAVFLYCLWLRARQDSPVGFRPVFVLAAGWLGYLILSVAHSPVRGAALEEGARWLDALLLFCVALTELSAAPEFFLLLLAGAAGILTLGGLLGLAAGGSRLAPPETPLTAGVALLSGAALFLGRTDPLFRARRFRRLGALLLGALALLLLDWVSQRDLPEAPERLAAQAIADQNRATGCGLGALPEMLTAYAPGDYTSLPAPRNSCLALRAELGWIGLGFLGFLAAVAFFSGFRIIRLFPPNPRTFAGVGLAALLVLTLLDARARPILTRPFGQLFLFVLMGLLMGTEQAGAGRAGLRPFFAPPSPSPLLWRGAAALPSWRELRRLSFWRQLPWRSAGQRLARPSTALFLMAAVAMGWISIAEARPWRAARLALPRAEESLFSRSLGNRLRQATAIYPHEASHWENLAVHLREVLARRPFNEDLFQQAVKAYEQAIEANPYRFTPHLSLGLVYGQAQRLTEMMAALRRGLQFHPQSETLRLWLVKACFSAGEHRQAVEQLNLMSQTMPPRLPPAAPGQPERVNPDWIKIHFRLAEVYEALGESGRALDHYAMAYQKDPMGPLHAEALGGMERLKAKILTDESARQGAPAAASASQPKSAEGR